MIRTAFKQIAIGGRAEGGDGVGELLNYYYVARKRGVKLRRRGRRRRTSIAGRRTGVSRIESVLNSLAELVRAQEEQLTTLRRENERFVELRRLIGL